MLLMTCPKSKTDQVHCNLTLLNTVEAHGGVNYDKAHYQFVFRKKTYTFKNGFNEFEYTVEFEKDGDKYVDKLNNLGFERKVNGEVIELSAKKKSSAAEGLNSVIYFATLPHKLMDDAVNVMAGDPVTIKEKQYDVLHVTFDQEGGGKDYQDEFIYWVNQDGSTIDFIAYSYDVNGGGVRFREAYNRRKVDGIVFQDYINFKADVGTPLTDLPNLWAMGSLKELSRIETEIVKNLK